MCRESRSERSRVRIQGSSQYLEVLRNHLCLEFVEKRSVKGIVGIPNTSNPKLTPLKPIRKKTSTSPKHRVDSRPCGNTNPLLLRSYVGLRQPGLSYNNTRLVVTKAAENNDTMSRKSPKGKVWELDTS